MLNSVLAHQIDNIAGAHTQMEMNLSLFQMVVDDPKGDDAVTWRMPFYKKSSSIDVSTEDNPAVEVITKEPGEKRVRFADNLVTYY